MAISTASRVRRHLVVNYGYLFALPYAILLLLFGIGPTLYALVISFSDPNSDAFSFNGLTNYITAFKDFRFASSFGNVSLYLIIWLPVTVLGVLLLALLLHARSGWFSSTMRLVYYLPGAIVGSASVLLWVFMLDPQISPIAPLLHALGFKIVRDALDTSHLPIVLTLIAFSAGAGGWIVVMYGAFQNISAEIMEAAIIDGCNVFQSAFYIKIPLIAKYIVYMVILSFAGGTQLFVEPQLIGKAVQNGTITPTWSPNELAYEFAFNLGNFGASAAIAMILLIIGLVGALLIIFGTNFFDMQLRKN